MQIEDFQRLVGKKVTIDDYGTTLRGIIKSTNELRCLDYLDDIPTEFYLHDAVIVDTQDGTTLTAVGYYNLGGFDEVGKWALYPTPYKVILVEVESNEEIGIELV